MIAQLLIATVVVPALFTVVLLIAGRWPRRRDESLPGWGSLVAVGAAYAAAQVTGLGAPPFPPVTASESVLYAALGALIAAALQRAWPGSAAVRWVPRVILVGALVPWIARPLVQHSWSPGESAFGIAVAAVTWLVLWGFLDIGSRAEVRRRWFPLTLAVIAGGSSAVLGLSGSVKYAQLAGALGAAAGVWWLVSLFWEPARAGAGSAALPAFLLGGLCVAGYLFAEMPLVSLVLVSVSPVAAELGGVISAGWHKRWAAAVLEVALAGVVVALAVLPPLVATLTAEQGGGYY